MAAYMIQCNLLLNISLVYLLVTIPRTRSSLSHDEECSALFQFKKSIIDQDDVSCAAHAFQTFHSWKPARNASHSPFYCCSWYGVECSNYHEYPHVVGLDLSESFLCGYINSTNTIFSLVYLQKLNLAMNDFRGSEIPSEIARLKQLRSLNLSSSGFTGQIPNEISRLMQLSSLDLSGNSLNLHNPSLKNLVQNLTKLEELNLSHVRINSSVPHFLANFSSLRSIMLSNCSLQNEFPVAILELPQLKILDVSYNFKLAGFFPEFRNNSLLEYLNLHSTDYFGIVPESISNLNHLTFLQLTTCFFSGRIPRSLSNLTQLTHLLLGGNMFTGFVPSLVSLSELNVLELTDIKFDNGRFPKWLGKLSKLNELDVSDTSLNSEIPPFLANLTKLSIFNMEYNSLIGHIPSSFFNLTQLTFLYLGENQLQGPISSSFSNLKSLQTLSLVSNDFSGRTNLDIFLGLNKLDSLELGKNMISLVSSNNYTNTHLPQFRLLHLSSCNLKEFPSFLRFQHRLERLLLYDNEIKGLIPVWIWNNSHETLEVINLENNSITGFHQHPYFLPGERLEAFVISNNQVQGRLPVPPQAMVQYIFSYNNLTGEIPPLICKSGSLLELDLSANNMSGTLPPCFGNLNSSLLVLNLRQNNFHGILPNVFMNGSKLRSIEWGQNGFTGQLPRSLTNCTDLEVLSLENNSFDDVFPFWLGTLPNLQVLVLRSNRFYGPIQGSITDFPKFPQLRIIDLSKNGFSGQLHKQYFQNWNPMKSAYVGNSNVMGVVTISGSLYVHPQYSMTLIHNGFQTVYTSILTIFMAIDLSCNHFEGEIPLSLQDLRGLQSINLSNNHFTGRVLPSFGNLKNLESLDLSQNELSGEIPQQLVELGFLSIFNVSFNNLEGHIPKGKQFNTFENNSYMGNSLLCGEPLSKECQDSKVSTLPQASNTTSNTSESESFLPNKRIDWIIIFCGVGSGLVVGVVIGNILYARYSDLFIKRKDKWVRPIRNTRRNQGVSASNPKGKRKV